MQIYCIKSYFLYKDICKFPGKSLSLPLGYSGQCFVTDRAKIAVLVNNYSVTLQKQVFYHTYVTF